MQNLKYHSINTLSILLFSYMFASTINQVVKFTMSPEVSKQTGTTRRASIARSRKTFEDYQSILESEFFQVASADDQEGDGGPMAGALEDLTLMGTITGPYSIARAMILKKGESNPGIFALYKVNSEITNDVYGHKLVSIKGTKVYLETGGERVALDLFAARTFDASKSGTQTPGGSSVKKTLSRAEVRQKVFNNLDNAMRGLRAGPYRVNNKIMGYRLINVRPYNILYKFGARSGDIIKRVNGKALDSTQKVYKMWETIKTESKITVDLERRGQPITFEFNVTD